jgi:hypothetical protein
MSKVIVNNSGKTTSYLPSHKGHFAFKPGANEIDQEQLDSVIAKQGDKWNNHYSRYLKVDSVKDSKPEIEIIEEPGEDSKTENEQPLTDKKVSEMKEVISGMDKDELLLLLGEENNRENGARSTVINMIEKALKKFDE